MRISCSATNTTMGSAPSTPNQDSRQTNDPWWPIENQNLTLNHSPLLAATVQSQLLVVNAGIESGQRSNSNTAADVNSTINHECRSVNNWPSHTESASGNNNLSFAMENENERSASIDSDNAESESSEVNEPRSSMATVVDRGDVMRDAESRRVSREERINKNLEQFKWELGIKREKRQNAIADLRNQIVMLRKQLDDEKALNRQLMNGQNPIDVRDIADVCNDSEGRRVDISNAVSDTTVKTEITLKGELAESQFALQLANADILSLNTELTSTRRHVTSLKDVIVVTKQMVQIREDQLAKVSSLLVIYAQLSTSITFFWLLWCR